MKKTLLEHLPENKTAEALAQLNEFRASVIQYKVKILLEGEFAKEMIDADINGTLFCTVRVLSKSAKAVGEF